MKSARSYVMTTRAASAEATRVRILDAAVDLASQRLLNDVSLDDVAARAGVSVQTVLRRFGGRQGLLDAAFDHGRQTIHDERLAAPGDVRAAVAAVVEHYERRGDGVLLWLAQENDDATLGRLTTSGKALHRQWVEHVFGPLLPAPSAAKDAAVDLLVVACDVYTWKLLRRDRGLSRALTTERMEQLARAVLADLGRTEG